MPAVRSCAPVQPLKAKRGGLFPEYSDAGVLDGPLEVALTETNRSWPRRVLEGCAIFALGLFGFAKISILFLAALWLIAKVFGFADFAWWIHHLGLGFMGVAIGLYLIFCWFLPDNSVDDWERVQAERAERYAALIRAMEQPEHWSNGSRIALVCDRPALLASLRAEGFHPGEVITLAKFLARKAIEKELQNHGFTIAHIESAHVKAVAEAVFAAQADALIAEAKAQLTDFPNKLSRRSKAVGGTER